MTKEGAQQLYAQWASCYTQDLQSWGYRTPALVAEAIASHWPSMAALKGDMLDLGCGTGALAHALASRGIQGSLVGLDLSSEMLRECRQKGLYDCVQAQDAQLPWPLGSAKLVCSAGVWGYIEHFPELYGNVAKHLVPGGFLVFSVKSEDWQQDARQVHSALLALGCMEEVPCIIQQEPYLPDHPDPAIHTGCIDVRTWRRFSDQPVMSE